MERDPERLNQISETVIGAAYEVANTLGAGFLEKVYENSLAIELRKRGLQTQQQVPIQVFYEGIVVGEYVADLLVEETLLLELKACKGIDPIHLAQCMNYLRATKLPLALLINFGRSRIEIKRIAN